MSEPGAVTAPSGNAGPRYVDPDASERSDSLSKSPRSRSDSNNPPWLPGVTDRSISNWRQDCRNDLEERTQVNGTCTGKSIRGDK